MKVEKNSVCGDEKPWAVLDDAGEKVSCHSTESEADEASTTTQVSDTKALQARMAEINAKLTPTTPEAPEPVTAASKTATSAAWKGTICVEGITSGDFREFAEGALTWADPPIPLRWKKEDAHGGVNDVTVAVGTITSIARDGQHITGEGVFDLGSEDGREAHRRVGEGFLAGISIDADDITDADVELIWPEEQKDSEDEDDVLAVLFASPDKIVFHAGRIRAATLCDIPAFVEATVALVASGEVEVPDGLEPAAVLDEKTRLQIQNDTLTAAGELGDHTGTVTSLRPPKEWFEDPKFTVPMNVVVTEEGRVYGHAAHWGECHIGHTDMCVTPPVEESHPYFLTGEMITADGSKVSVGQITLATGHAPLAYSAGRAAEHYDNTGSCVADITIGNDQFGIWVAGAIRSGTDPQKVRDLRASGKVSGDWRRIGGQLRLVGLLGVNVAGFMTPQVRSRVASGHQMALVAAGLPKIGASTVDVEKRALRIAMDMITNRLKIEGK